MTDKNKTEIAVVLDRSGSMERIREDMVGGFATFIKEQHEAPGECVLSLYQFDDKYDVVYEERPLARVEGLRLTPRGSTALLDAVGRTIARLGERLAAKPEEKRPGAVIVLIITDGMENASHEFTADTVRQLIAKQEKDYNWRFVYLGADAKAFKEAQMLGIQAAGMFTNNAQGVGAAYSSSSAAVRQYRVGVSRGITGQSIQLEATQGFTTQDPDENNEPK